LQYLSSASFKAESIRALICTVAMNHLLLVHAII
jgi:hypothetical protein